MMVKVLLVDDHAIVRDGLQMIIDTQNDMKVLAGVGNGRNAVEVAEDLRPDVVVMDISMPEINGIELIHNMLAHLPWLKIIILTMHEFPEYVSQAFKAGAGGYLLKKSAAIEVIKAIREVIAGQRYLGRGVKELLSVDMLDRVDPYETLTQREKQILTLVVDGKTSEEIADTVFISRKSVETYRSRIFRKLGIDNNVASLVRFAVMRGLVRQ